MPEFILSKNFLEQNQKFCFLSWIFFLNITFGVVGKSSSGEIEWVNETEWHGTGESTRCDVGGELERLAGVLFDGEEVFDLSLEGEVQRLGREVSQHVGKVSSPESADSLESQIWIVFPI